MSAPAAILIGTGVNELVCAHYLARAGHRVLVLEQHAQPDGYECGWVAPAIARDLGLDRHGFTVERPDPWVVAPLEAGGRLALSMDMARSIDAIRRVSVRDAGKWPAFCARMGRCARLLEALYAAPPPAPMSREPGELWRLALMGLRARRMGGDVIAEFLRIAAMPVADLLDDWFESGALKAALAVAGVMHLAQGPRSGGTAFVFLHHHVGSPAGVFRPPHTNARRVLTGLPGIDIRRGAKVERIVVRAGRVAGVVLTGGEKVAAARVISGADPRRTLGGLVDAGWLDPALVRAVRHIRARGVAARVDLVTERPAAFKVLTVAPDLDYIERAHDDAKYGRISREPWLEARSSAANGGRRRIEVHMQYAPYALGDGSWDDVRSAALAEVAVKLLSRHVPDLGAGIVERRVHSPRELEIRYGHPEGQVCHAELALDQALWMRPVAGIAHYRTPVAGLYLCGPGTHPGAGIAGASGAHAARTILDDLR